MASTPYNQRETGFRLSQAAKKIRNSVFIKGKLVVLKTYLTTPPVADPVLRGEIKEFSPGSRFRLLKKIATIDWDKLPQGLFVTLTYPDKLASAETKTTTMHRHHWIRYMEKYLCEKVPILWRKEQQRRKSGDHVGLHVQHYHLCIFTDKLLPHELVRDWWRRTIKAVGPLATDVKRMDSGEHAAFYLAKYLSKRESSPSLDYVSYLTKPGRAWGFHRPQLLPYHPTDSFVGLTEEQYEAILDETRPLWSDGSARTWQSFTLLGQQAEEAAKKIYEILA